MSARRAAEVWRFVTYTLRNQMRNENVPWVRNRFGHLNVKPRTLHFAGHRVINIFSLRDTDYASTEVRFLNTSVLNTDHRPTSLLRLVGQCQNKVETMAV